MPEQQSRWHHLYCTRIWRKRSAYQRRIQPLCQMCLDKGIVTVGDVADHVVPHHGDEQLFYFGKLVTLCNPCHSSTKRQLENKGYIDDIGADGWPVDPMHPANRAK